MRAAVRKFAQIGAVTELESSSCSDGCAVALGGLLLGLVVDEPVGECVPVTVADIVVFAGRAAVTVESETLQGVASHISAENGQNIVARVAQTAVWAAVRDVRGCALASITVATEGVFGNFARQLVVTLFVDFVAVAGEHICVADLALDFSLALRVVVASTSSAIAIPLVL